MQKSIFSALLLISLISPQLSFAKIGDCPVIIEGNIVYHSHSEFVEAVRFNEGEKFDTVKNRLSIGVYEDEQIVWHRQLYNTTSPKFWNPMLESDVQANITCIREITGNEIRVTDKKGRVFYVDKTTGKLLRTLKEGKVIDNPVITTPTYTAIKLAELQTNKTKSSDTIQQLHNPTSASQFNFFNWIKKLFD